MRNGKRKGQHSPTYELGDIGTPNGPAEDGTRGLLKAHYPKFMKLGSPVKRFGKIELY